MLSRPWKADEYLKGIITLFVSGRSSMSQIIQNSRPMRTIFQDFVQRSHGGQISKRVTNLRAAKHRYESMQKPLGRAVLWLLPQIQTALHIVNNRHDRFVPLAKSWLSELDDEKCIQLGMMADAADEALVLVRFLDDEDLDVATLMTEVQNFVDKIEALFGGEAMCLELDGYTKYMLSTLSTPIIFQVGKESRSLGVHGGVSPTMINSCLQRMRAWTVLMKAVVLAEFPTFDMVRAFGAFSLPAKPADIKIDNLKPHLERLAVTANLDVLTLQAEYQDVAPRACVIKKVEGMTNQKAWHAAVDRLNQHHSTRKSHPTQVLQNALQLYILYGASTSGVEQNFSTGKWAINERQGRFDGDTESMFLKLAIDLQQNSINVVIEVARRIWLRCYNAPRFVRLRSRIDKGLSRPAKRKLTAQEAAGEESERTFLKKRRLASREAAASSSAADHPVLVARSAWSEKHAKEVGFQVNKTRLRRMQAATEGTLLESETSPALVLEQKQYEDQRVKALKAKDRAENRAVNKITDASLKDTEASVIRSNVFASPGLETPVLQSALQRLKMRHMSLSDSDVIIVANPASPDERSEWVACLRGGRLVHPNYFVDGSGILLKYVAAADDRRLVYVSAESLREHNQFWKFIHGVVAGIPRARWEWLWGDETEFVRMKRVYKTPSRVLAVVRSAEKKKPCFKNFKHVFNIPELLAFNKRFETNKCSWGLTVRPSAK